MIVITPSVTADLEVIPGSAQALRDSKGTVTETGLNLANIVRPVLFYRGRRSALCWSPSA